MCIMFCIGLTYIIISIMCIITSTLEYFINEKITKRIVKEYKKALKIAIILLIIGLIFINITIYFDGVPKPFGW